MFRGVGLFAVGFTVAIISTLPAQTYKRDQFTHRIDMAVSSIKETEGKYKDIDKELKKQFPKRARSSPIYLSLKSEYTELRGIVDRIITAGPLFKKNNNAFEKLFGGPLKRKPEIRSADEEFSDAKRLSGELEAVLSSVTNDLTKAAPLEQFLAESLERAGKVQDVSKEMEKQISSFSRDVERNRKAVQRAESQVSEVIAWLRHYPLSIEGETIRKDLSAMQQAYSDRHSSLQNMAKQMKHFLSGAASKGEEETVWAKFDQIDGDRIQLAVQMEETPENIEKELKKLAEFTEKIGDFKREVSSSKNDLDGEIRSVTREVEKNSKLGGVVSTQFDKSKSGMEPYPIIIKSDSVRARLLAMQSDYDVMIDSLNGIARRYDRFLSGNFVPSEGTTARITYDGLLERQKNRLRVIEQQPDLLALQREKLDDLIGLIGEFKEVLEDMERDIASLDTAIREEEDSLVDDSLRYVSLTERMPDGFTASIFPYRDLNGTYSDIKVKLNASRQALSDLRKAHEHLISHVGKMDGIKTDDTQYTRFKQLQKDFGEANKRGERRLKELDDAIEEFRRIILKNFLNTPEYWALQYAIEEESVRRASGMSENFGYLLDMNRYRVQKYHGHLVSDFQLRLASKGAANRSFELIFSGSHEFPVKGVQLLSSSGEVLFESLRDSVTSKNEETSEGFFTFEWRLPVTSSVLTQIATIDDHSMRIMVADINSRVNLTGYTVKIYKRYRIPKERLENWKRMLGLIETVS